MGVLDDKVAIVTGSARGIGRATAELLSEHGAKLIINDLDADLAEQAASEIAGETAVYGGDLTAPGAPDALVQTALDAVFLHVSVPAVDLHALVADLVADPRGEQLRH